MSDQDRIQQIRAKLSHEFQTEDIRFILSELEAVTRARDEAQRERAEAAADALRAYEEHDEADAALVTLQQERDKLLERLGPIDPGGGDKIDCSAVSEIAEEMRAALRAATPALMTQEPIP